jgi:acetolactate decarboxylase
MTEHATPRVDRHDDYAVYQTSTMAALLSGLYDGDVTIQQLLTHGDFGLGTFNHLDGEMVVLDGVCYHLRDDGSVQIAEPTDRTPFAAVMHFASTKGFDVTQTLTLAELERRIDETTGGQNLPVAVRIDGMFSPLTTRTVGEQHKPYPLLTDATAHEAVNTLDSTQGTVAGFRTPQFEAAISVAGYHLHYADDARQNGGHVLDLTITSGHVSITPVAELRLVLPDTPEFREATIDLADVQAQEERAEGSGS